jgi:hypothetical protein
MNEDISTLIIFDKTKSLACVEPFYFPFWHSCSNSFYRFFQVELTPWQDLKIWNTLKNIRFIFRGLKIHQTLKNITD